MEVWWMKSGQLVISATQWPDLTLANSKSSMHQNTTWKITTTNTLSNSSLSKTTSPTTQGTTTTQFKKTRTSLTPQEVLLALKLGQNKGTENVMGKTGNVKGQIRTSSTPATCNNRPMANSQVSPKFKFILFRCLIKSAWEEDWGWFKCRFVKWYLRG